MAIKEFRFRGKSLQELQALSLKEFAELITSRERRTLNRGFTHDEKKLMAKLEKKNTAKTHSREMIILPSFVGKTIKVYNGKQYVDVNVVEEMVGKRLGQYAQTRKKAGHTVGGVGKTKGKVSVK